MTAAQALALRRAYWRTEAERLQLQEEAEKQPPVVREDGDRGDR